MVQDTKKCCSRGVLHSTVVVFCRSNTSSTSSYIKRNAALAWPGAIVSTQSAQVIVKFAFWVSVNQAKDRKTTSAVSVSTGWAKEEGTKVFFAVFKDRQRLNLSLKELLSVLRHAKTSSARHLLYKLNKKTDIFWKSPSLWRRMEKEWLGQEGWPDFKPGHLLAASLARWSKIANSWCLYVGEVNARAGPNSSLG